MNLVPCVVVAQMILIANVGQCLTKSYHLAATDLEIKQLIHN